jgi:hypothetical protein
MPCHGARLPCAHTSQLISVNGRTDVMKDVQAGTPGANFPWVPKPMANLGHRHGERRYRLHRRCRALVY